MSLAGLHRFGDNMGYRMPTPPKRPKSKSSLTEDYWIGQKSPQFNESGDKVLGKKHSPFENLNGMKIDDFAKKVVEIFEEQEKEIKDLIRKNSSQL